MDFWSRLVGGSGRQGSSVSPKKTTPQQRLSTFRRIYDVVQQTCSRPQQLNQPGAKVDQLASDLKSLSTLSREELRTPAPYPCLSFASANQIYSVIGRAASACKDERVIRGAVEIFSILIDSEVEGFTTNKSFARALMRFSMRVLDSAPYVSTETESQLVEVLFNIAAKIRLEPEILDIWFQPSSRILNEEAFVEKKSFVGITQKDDFPLCYLFIDRVHNEGRIGDFARTGLLYIFESASRSEPLDQWIVASDLPTLMASALGALYSQLSRELSLSRDSNDLPMLLALSDYTESESEVETISSESHKASMATFLADLRFWQDILDHCRSVDVKQTLLDHFQILFLQQLLYPSLLQSSDTDGGSSVAVMTYLASILQTLTDQGLANMLLSYLLGTQSPPPNRTSSPTVMRRRSSLLLITSPPSEDDRLEPSLFNLTDLIHNGLLSKNSQTTFAALKLFTTILTLQPAHALGSLLRLDIDRHTSGRTIGALETETSNLMKIAISIGGVDGLDEAYDGISADVRKGLDAIAFRHIQSAHTIDSRNSSVILGDMQKAVPKSMLNLSETGMRAIIRLIERFLSNSVETNLALTETVMAICMEISVDVSDLIAIRPDRYRFVEKKHSLDPSWLDSEEAEALDELLSANRQSLMTPTNTPLMLSALRRVEVQVTHLRQSLSRFDALLSKRKSILEPPKDDNLFSTPIKTRGQQRISTPMSRHASPAPMSHGRQGSLTGTPPRPISPARSGSIPRGRLPSAKNSPIAALSPAHASASHSRKRSSIVSPVRTSLSANVFRPPPPEPGMNLSPPRMVALRASSPGPGSPVSLSGQDHNNQSNATNDAETLRLRIRFDNAGKILAIVPPDPPASSQAPSRARSPAGLAVPLGHAGEAPPVSSRGSSVSAGRANSPVVHESAVVDDDDDEDEDDDEVLEVSLSHTLTNVVILQSFILELVAVLQLRARIYEGEVSFGSE